MSGLVLSIFRQEVDGVAGDVVVRVYKRDRGGFCEGGGSVSVVPERQGWMSEGAAVVLRRLVVR